MDSSESDEFATSSTEFAGPGDAIGCFYDAFDVIKQPRCGQGVYALSSKAHRIDKLSKGHDQYARGLSDRDDLKRRSPPTL